MPRSTPVTVLAFSLALAPALGACLDSSDDVIEEDPAAPAAFVVNVGDVGWVWAPWPTLPSYVAPAGWSYNVTNGENRILRTGVGSYQVQLDGLTSGRGNPHVVAQGSGAARCKIELWNANSLRTHINVGCHTAQGQRVDSPFFLYYAQSNNIAGGYLWSGSVASSHDADPFYSHNSAGGINSIERVAIGRYRVRFGGLNNTQGHPLVTAYGSDAAHCKSGGWSLDGSDTIVDVRCFAGAFNTDSSFNLRFVRQNVGFYALGYAWMHNPTAASYTPSAVYSHNSEGGANLATRAATGRYVDRFDNLQFGDGSGYVNLTALASAYGTDSKYCKVFTWTGTEDYLNVHVDCYTADGVLADTPHNTLGVTFKPTCWNVCEGGICHTECA